MIRKILPLLIILTWAGCETSGEEKKESTQKQLEFQLHADVKDGRANEVIALEKLDTLYHLIYATGSRKWGRLASSDLKNWEQMESIDLEEGFDGALALDLNSTKGLPARWNRLEQEDGELFLFSSADGINWKSSEKNPVLKKVNGPIRITWNQTDENWLMTEVTSEGQINVYNSKDWTEWASAGTITTSISCSRASILPLDDTWLLQAEGASLRWYELEKQDDAFVLYSENALSEYHGIQRASVYQSENETIVIGFHTMQNEWTPTFSIPLTLELYNGKLELGNPDDLKQLLISKRRGVLSKLKAVGPSQYSLNLPAFTNTARLDLIADSTRIASLFLDRNKKQITWDRSLHALGDSESASLPWLNPGDSLQLDLILDGSTYDVMLDKGNNFGAVFHLGTHLQATSIRWFSGDTEMDIPGSILTYQLRRP